MSIKQDGNTFTARDFQLLAAAMDSTKAPIEVNYKLFAEKAGFKGAPSAKASWNALKKKIGRLNSGGGGSVAPSLTITPAESGEKGGKKRKMTDDDDEDDEEPEPAPTKSTKKGRRAPTGKAAASSMISNQYEDQDDEEHVGSSGTETKTESTD